MVNYEQLKLENQICFPFYAISRLIIRQYQPFLDEFGITYPQYLVLLVLWETDGLSVNDISRKLILNTNTITPLLKRMETLGLVKRTKSKTDERKVMVTLTDKAWALREKAACIPYKLIGGDEMNKKELDKMTRFRQELITFLNAMLENEKTVEE